MTALRLSRLLQRTPQLVVAIAATTLILFPTGAIAQSPASEASDATDAVETPAAEPAIVPLNPLDLRPLTTESALSLPGLERSIAQADAEILSKNYDAAYDTLIAARETSNTLASYYQQLSGQFSGIDNRIYEEHRRRALTAAQLRDDATYRLAFVHQARGQAELAVPLLLQVLSSQSPTRDLGRDAYNLLHDLGFVPTPYAGTRSASVEGEGEGDSDAIEADPEAPDGEAGAADGEVELIEAVNSADNGEPTIITVSESVVRPLDDGILSAVGLSRAIAEAESAVESGDNRAAIAKLQDARQLANELSSFYQQLTSSFAGIDDAIYQTHRANALETAQLRDEATYNLALLFRAAEASELAVPLLMEVITSQSPTRDLGKQAYRQLFELGFVDENYPRGQI